MSLIENETLVPAAPKQYGTKNKAPVVIDGRALTQFTSTELQKQKAERLKKWEKSLHTPLPSAECPLATSARNERELATTARIHFKKRNETKLPANKNNWNQVARVLDTRQQTTANTFCDSSLATPEERIFLYSKSHKCPHKRHYNSWKIDGSTIVPLCDHEYETLTKTPGPRCHICGRPTVFVNRICNCKCFSCTRCFATMYPHTKIIESEFFEDTETTIYKNFDAHRELMFNYVTSKLPSLATTPAPWAHLAASTPQMGPAFFATTFSPPSSLFRYVPNLESLRTVFSKLKQFFVTIKDFLLDIFNSTVSNFSKWLKDNVILNSVLAFSLDFLSFVINSLTDDASPMFYMDLLLLAPHHPYYATFRFLTPLFTKFIKLIYSTYPQTTGKVHFNSLTLKYDRNYTTSAKTFSLSFIHNLITDPSCLNIFTQIISAFKFFFMEDDQDATPIVSFQNKNSATILPSTYAFSVIKSGQVKPVPHSRSSSSPVYDDRDPFVSPYTDTAPSTSATSKDTAQSGFDFIKSFLNAYSLLSKELLPIFSLANITTALLERLPRLVTKIFSFFSTTTQQWIECETSIPTSPLAQYLDASYKYWSSYNSDDARVSSQFHYEGKRLGSEALAHAKAQGRYDTTFIKWYAGIEKVFDHPRVPATRSHEPFCIRMVGQPGVGKSTTYRSLLAPIFGCTTKEEVDNLCFVRGMSEYWDGCIGRPVVVFDDFGQDRTQETDIRDMITLVSDAPFMPNFASLTGSNPKGTTYDPKIVIACSNAVIDDAKSIACPAALARRFHIVIDVSLNDAGVRQYKVVSGVNTRTTRIHTNENQRLTSSLYDDRNFASAFWPSGPLSLTELQEFIYNTFNRFLETRKKGVSSMEESYPTTFKPLLTSKNGLWSPQSDPKDTPVLSYSDPALQNHFNLFLLTHKLNYINYSVFSFDFIFSLTSKIVFIAAVAKFLFSFFFPSAPVNSAQSSTAKGKIAPAKFVVQNDEPQASDNISDMMRVIEKNAVNITVGRMTTAGIFVAGTTILTVEHLFIDKYSPTGGYVPDGTIIELSLFNRSEPVVFPFCRSQIVPIIKESGDCDAVLFTVPESFVNLHRNIVNYFWKGDYAISNRRIIATDFNFPANTVRLENAVADSFLESSYDVGKREYNQTVAHANYLGRKGQCGSPILDAQVNQAPILGIHVGINNASQRSIFILINQTLLNKHLFSAPLNRLICEPHCTFDYQSTERGANHVRGSMEIVGTLTRPLFTPDTTQLRKSEIFDLVIPHTTEPSVLKGTDPRLETTVDLWDKVTTKLSRQMKPPPSAIFEQSQLEMDQMVLGLPLAGPRRLLTLDEALNGSLDFPHLKSIDMSTSCGYPWVLDGIKKDQLFERINDRLVPTRLFMDAYECAWDSVRNNTVPDFIMLCSLKDERRPLEKVRLGKTRLFTVAPLVMNVLLKQFFGLYANTLMDNFFKTTYSGKVDRLGASWSTMMQHLREVSPVGFGADFEQYDGRLEKSRMTRSMFRMALPLKNVLTDLENKMLQALVVATTQPYYAFEQMIVSVPGSLASGIWITQLLGSDMTHTMLYEAWLSVVPVEFKCMYYFKTFTRLRVMGDDHIVAVVPALTKFYNGTTVCQYFRDHEMGYTSPEKSGDPEPVLPLEQIAFLKNKTGFRWGMYIPLMDLEAALEPMNWIRKHEFMTSEQLTEINVNGSLRAVFFHGPEMFNKYRDAVLKIKPHYSLLTYGYLKGVFLSYGYFPGCEHGEPSFYELATLPTPEPKPLPEMQLIKEKTGEPSTPQSDDRPPTPLPRKIIPKMKFLEVTSDTLLVSFLENDHPASPTEPPHSLNSAAACPIVEEPASSDIAYLLNRKAAHTRKAMNKMQNLTATEFENLFNAYKDKAALYYAKNNPPAKIPDASTSEISVEHIRPTNSIGAHKSTEIIKMNEPQILRRPTDKTELFKLKPAFTTESLSDQDVRYVCKYCLEVFAGWNSCVAHQFTSHCDTYPSDFFTLEEKLEECPVPMVKKTICDLNNFLTGYPSPNPTRLTLDIMYHGGTQYVKPVLTRLNAWTAYLNRTIPYSAYRQHCTDFPLPSISHPKTAETETPSRLCDSSPQGGDPHSNEPNTPATTVNPSTFVPERNTVIDNPVSEDSAANNNLGWTNREKNVLETVTPAGATGSVTAKRAETSLNDIAWRLDTVLKRWNQVAVLKWNISDAVGTVVARYDVIQDLLQSSVVSMPFVNFEKFRCSAVRFKFMLVGSKFHQGRLLCSFVPTMCPSTVHRGDTSNATLIEIGGVQLDPSSGSDVEFTVPWNHLKGYLDLIAGDVLGQLHVTVLNQLRAVTGASTSVNLKILFCLEDPEFKIPRPSVGTFHDVSTAHLALQRRLNSTPQSGEAEKNTKNISSINNMSQNEALEIAPVRALTGDTEVTHFGEKYSSLRDIGKRYRPVVIQESTFTRENSSVPIRGVFTLRNVLIRSFPEITPFKLIRGGINLKVIVSVYRESVDLSAPVYYKHTMLITANSPYSNFSSFDDSLNYFEYSHNFNNPLSRTDETSAAEFYVPFMQHSATCFQPRSMEAPGTTASNLLSEFSITPEIIVDIYPNTSQTNGNIFFEIYAALSDEFACGAFIGTPLQTFSLKPGCGFTTTSRKQENQTKPPAIIRWNKPRRVTDSPQGLEDLIQPLIERVIPENILTDALGALLDKPEISIPPTLYKARKTDFLSHAVGQQAIEKLQLYPASQQTTDPEHFCSPRDEMDYRFHIKNRRSLITTLTWADTNAVGDILFSSKLGPMGFYNNPLPTSGKMNLLDYFGRMFTFWRGGITLIFDVVTSAYHEGKLEITYHPNSMTVPADYDARVSQYVVSSVVKNTENVFGVTFPFLSETPWKRIWNGFALHDNSVSNPAPNVQDYFLGSFSVTVAAPLRVPSTVSPSVDVNVYIQAADDFEYNVVSQNGWWAADSN